MPLATKGVNHFAISVPDLEATVEWYRRVLGFRLICRQAIPGVDVRVAHMEGPGFVLEVFEPIGGNPLPEGRKLPNTDLMTHGNKHLSLTVNDAEEARKSLEDMGVPVVMTARVWGTVGVFIHDNSGNLIEIFEGDMRVPQDDKS